MKNLPTEEQLLRILDHLDSKDSVLLKLRFGLSQNAPKSMEELAIIYGVTREQIYTELLRVERLTIKNFQI